MVANPFIHATKIRDPLYFYGREAEARRILEFIGQNQCCVIVGGSKVGKSSLLNYISLPETRHTQGLDSDRDVFVEFDFQMNQHISWADFWRQLLGDVLIELRDDELKQAVERVRQDLAQISEVGFALQQMDAQRIDRRELQGHLATYFNLEELKQLAFDIDVDYGELPNKRQAFARELVLYCERRDRLDDLVAAYSAKRQQISLTNLNQDRPEVSRRRNRIQSQLFDLFQAFRRQAIRLVFLFDEFESIKDARQLFEGAFLNYLRSLHNRFGVVYVLATDTELERLAPQKEIDSDFINIFQAIFLGMFKRRELRNLITQEKAPIEPSLSDDLPFVFRLAGGHPYMTQSVCRHLYDIKSEIGELTEADYDQVTKESLDDLFLFLDGRLWASLNSEERRVLTQVARGMAFDEREDPLLIRRLNRTKQYIKQTDSGWVMFCDLVKDYILTYEPEV